MSNFIPKFRRKGQHIYRVANIDLINLMILLKFFNECQGQLIVAHNSLSSPSTAPFTIFEIGWDCYYM